MKKMTKWIVACAVCVLGSVPTAGADIEYTPGNHYDSAGNHNTAPGTE